MGNGFSQAKQGSEREGLEEERLKSYLRHQTLVVPSTVCLRDDEGKVG